MANGNRDKTIKKIFLAVVAAAFVFLCAGILLRYIGPSPVPSRIFTQLQRMDAVGKNVKLLVGQAKAANSSEALTAVQAEYETVQVSFNQALQRVRDGLNVNVLDSSDTLSTLGAIEKNELALQDHLQPLSHQTLNADSAAYLEFLWKFVEAGVTSWRDLIKDQTDAKRNAADMLQRMQWPDWDNIQKGR
jgi:hypothetical protein